MGIFKRKKQLTVYALIHKQIITRFLTISENIMDTYEYAMTLLKVHHQQHFTSWCQVRNLDKEDFNTWLKYYSNCISDEEKSDFQTLKIKYNIKDVVAIMRMFGNCFPIGCSFDTEAEALYFKSIINEQFSKASKETVKGKEEVGGSK